MNANAPSFVPSNSHRNNNNNNNNNNSSNHNGSRRKRHQKRNRSTNNNNNNDIEEQLDLVQIAQQTGGTTDRKGRVSLNHLLNFSFPQRQRPQPIIRRQKITSYQPYNKERFVNANFRFMLNPFGDYNYQLADPDINFDWDAVEQVIISSNEVQACPICLSMPTAARVTRCGHVFCLPCVLHYLELRENPKRLWRKCPICWDSIYETDIKAVKIIESRPIKEGDIITLSLIQRPNHSTLAFPISDTWPLPENVISNYIKPDEPLIPWNSTPSAALFARFMLASPDYLVAEYERDSRELDDAMSDAIGWGSVDEVPFIEKSKKMVHDHIKRIRHQKTKELDLVQSTLDMMYEAVAKYHKKHAKAAEGIESHSSPEEENSIPEAYRQHHSQQGEKPLAKVQNSTANDYYFYQAKDGQHVYLHPLDIRILKHEFGDYHQFPHELEVQITNVQESTLDEDLRKKCKYLSHLPLGCDVTFLEINIKDIVSEDTFQVFNNELNARFRRRKEKEQREDKEREYAENKSRLQAVKEQEDERRRMESDPFFSMYRQPDDEEEQLAQAMSESLAIAGHHHDDEDDGPRTVWGTRMVANPEEEHYMDHHDWADHIVITKSKRKGRSKKR
ncbi:uncharacterized protein RHIMIDRAFT_139375 [Rhizopus microsporus ATCC 52813]|uniref:RING-type domain-containing protein n=2 Tax=Rhizopus microsporus TaxID=58291 RepID=A0A2G4STC2_RHIZD|nr:uncharacterized protein RHIMIDRAFT_139375 [Rhizopus microsporus ATCC 52813]PHZ12038.1 hypothetical protein RHIMIDRAFT_139375 [Rhizopus microsporus ATCC 52813]